jgi:hypothetical protein
VGSMTTVPAMTLVEAVTTVSSVATQVASRDHSRGSTRGCVCGVYTRFVRSPGIRRPAVSPDKTLALACPPAAQNCLKVERQSEYDNLKYWTE